MIIIHCIVPGLRNKSNIIVFRITIHVEVEKIEKIMTKVKFIAFGKVKRKPANDGDQVDAILKDANDRNY